ncbi:ArsR/SmtB family transcription factor [Priestia taiwanensis]|uniref:Transcriptional regulator n=1 Tax=Priestia taiwanensis TaxID=1347902 RepID=A0A917AKY2_9BACI|nr:metalloregulator ArsR/SmtB family transcription factor [Priestia taiwanensis]MBM7362034.1 DNA-binding transcriptional ArsR family regulator [Priestia taiwanensis]GGE58936.1 transcriptional regulator [Priestia taiwanensis]
MGQQALSQFRACIPVFQLLCDPNRQDIILLLSKNSALTVNEITAQSSLSRPAISHHLKLLREQGLVTVDKRGTERYYSLSLGDAVESWKKLIALIEDECL